MLPSMSDRSRGVTKALAAPLWVILLVVSACGSSDSDSSDDAVAGASARELRTVPEFDAVIVDDGVVLTIGVDPEATGDVQLQVSTDPDLLEALLTTVDDRTLTASVDGPEGGTNPSSPFEVSGEVTVLRDVVVRNGAEATLRGAVAEITVSALGGATVDATTLTAERVVVDADNGAVLTVCASESVTGTVSNGAALTVLCGGDSTEVVTGNAGTVTEDS